MKFYTVYSKKLSEQDSYVLVKDGFNWYSLIFSVFWALYKRIWNLVLVHVFITILLTLCSKINLIDSLAHTILSVAFSIAIAFHANDFYRESLEKRGYTLEGLSASINEDLALIRFLDGNLVDGRHKG